MEPTKEQIQWFWEQCGLEVTIEKVRYPHCWESWEVWEKDGKRITKPILDLNNLFEYAVPRIQQQGMSLEVIAHQKNGCQCRIATPSDFVEMGNIISVCNEDPALALFWAIYKAFED